MIRKEVHLNETNTCTNCLSVAVNILTSAPSRSATNSFHTVNMVLLTATSTATIPLTVGLSMNITHLIIVGNRFSNFKCGKCLT